MDYLKSEVDSLDIGWDVEIAVYRPRGKYVDAKVFIIDANSGKDLYECEEGDDYYVHSADFGCTFIAGAKAMQSQLNRPSAVRWER